MRTPECTPSAFVRSIPTAFRLHYGTVLRAKGQVLTAPILQHADEMQCRVTAGSGQRILNMKHSSTQVLSHDETVSLHLAKVLRKHLLRRLGKQPAQFAKTRRSMLEP